MCKKIIQIFLIMTFQLHFGTGDEISDMDLFKHLGDGDEEDGDEKVVNGRVLAFYYVVVFTFSMFIWLCCARAKEDESNEPSPPRNEVSTHTSQPHIQQVLGSRTSSRDDPDLPTYAEAMTRLQQGHW